MKTHEQKLEEEIEKLADEIYNPETGLLKIENEIDKEKHIRFLKLEAELKGYTQAKKECEIEIAELKDKINNLLDCNLKLIKYEETIRKEVIEEVEKRLIGHDKGFFIYADVWKEFKKKKLEELK